jgi:hypothetical protein
MAIITDEAQWVVHRAGPLVESVQCCVDCGALLVDDRDITWVGRPVDRRYSTGAGVAVLLQQLPTPAHPEGADVVRPDDVLRITAPHPIGRRMPAGHRRCTQPPKDR